MGTNMELDPVAVCVANTVEIPAQTEVEFIATLTQKVAEDETWLLEGMSNKHQPLMIARSLVIPERKFFSSVPAQHN